MNKTWITAIAIIVVAIIGWYLLSSTTEAKEVTTSTQDSTTQTSGGLGGLMGGVMGFFTK